MQKRLINKMLLWSPIVFGIAIVLLIFVYRPWAVNWGATDDEINRSMPGDEIVQNSTFNATRAVTIRAQPEEIWPWILQIGYKKAGFYCYDWFDNDGIPSAERIMPEYQDLKVGDLIPLSVVMYVKVTELRPDQSMLWVFQEGCGPWTGSTWAWELYQKDPQHTRLLTRLRVHTDSIISRIMLDFFEIVMMRKSMLGIKERAERMAALSEPGCPTPLLWGAWRTSEPSKAPNVIARSPASGVYHALRTSGGTTKQSLRVCQVCLANHLGDEWSHSCCSNAF